MGDTLRQPQVAHNGVRTLLKMLMDRSDVHSAFSQGSSLFCIRLELPQRAPLRF